MPFLLQDSFSEPGLSILSLLSAFPQDAACNDAPIWGVL